MLDNIRRTHGGSSTPSHYTNSEQVVEHTENLKKKLYDFMRKRYVVYG